MAQERSIEVKVGALILVSLGILGAFILVMGGLTFEKTYTVYVDFDNPGGLQTGAPVRIAGVKVGSIVSEALDPKSFLATVRISIDPAYQLPDDTVAEIISAGLLGDRFMALVPGGSEQMIPPGGRIKFTQSPVSLENLIGQMIFSQPGAQKKPGEGEAPPK